MKDILTNAIGYWEPRRIWYNFVLAAIFAACLALNWPRIAPDLSTATVVPLAVLTVLANVCYSVAYMADIPLQYSGFGDIWRKRRILVWIGGTGFAALLTMYWTLDEILPGLAS